MVTAVLMVNLGYTANPAPKKGKREREEEEKKRRRKGAINTNLK